MMRNAASLVLLVCGACRVAIPPVPGEGGPAWTELTSDHFVVWTDSSPEKGRELIRVMENLRQIIFGVSVFNPTSNARAFVVAMRNRYEVRPYVPEDVVAIAWPPDYPLYQPGILLSVHDLDYNRVVVTHELAHVISYNALSAQPVWLAEGLASYFETVKLDEEDGSFSVGVPDSWKLRVLQGPDGVTHMRDMLACTDRSCRDYRFYPSAWALFAYLTNHRPAELLRYVQRLVEIAPDRTASAWSEIFPDLTPEKLDSAVLNWIRFGELTVHRYKIKLKRFSATTRPLGDGEVHAVRALLRDLSHTGGPVPAEITADINAALAIDPTNLVAQMLRMGHERRIAPDVARGLTTAHPDNWRAWLLLESALQPGVEADAARERLCSLAAAELPRAPCPKLRFAADASSAR